MTLSQPFAGYLTQARELALLAIGFFALALLVKGMRAVTDSRDAAKETKNNIALFVLETLAVAPYVGLAVGWVHGQVHGTGEVFVGAPLWTAIGPVGSFVCALFLCDFVAYVSHRLYHTKWLWPVHAVHHSDTHLTWFSLLRQHPFERLRALVDLSVMILLGLPDLAILSVAMVRTYWGYLIHADLPWTLGPLSWLLVSPAMHRWHHALEARGAGVNFGIVFSVFDRMFGTYHVPGLHTGETGVAEVIAPGIVGQYLHPFRAWTGSVRRGSGETELQQQRRRPIG